MSAIHHVNLQPAVGGGEIYTRWFTRALADAGAQVSLYVDPANRFWDALKGPRISVVPLQDPESLFRHLGSARSLVVTQGPLPPRVLDRLAREHVLTGFAHMPMHGRSALAFARYALVFTVSRYCVDLLKAAGVAQVYGEPLYGTFELDRPAEGAIERRSPYIWDRRKLRDRLLGALEPIAGPRGGEREFRKGPGLTLGVVSLLAPIKQFPALFSRLAPLIAARPAARLEIFGRGGFAQVRDLRRALAPLGERARFWGFHEAVQQIYPQLDYLMTGLPEKEALGLNALEAQACGTPVLAPHAAPFTETVLHEKSGFLYRDPREDGGADFGRLLDSLLAGRARPDPRQAAEHLAKFSYAALVERARRVVAHLEERFAS